jgi:hypothetical protein
MARLKGYLYQTTAGLIDKCPYGRAKETVDHFLFWHVKWTILRQEIIQCAKEKRGNLSFYLGGKAASDGLNEYQTWTPYEPQISFAIATGRLEQK